MDNRLSNDPSSGPASVAPVSAEGASTSNENPGFGNFFNRELSLLQFNHRVLELARDPQIPLLERLRFLTISATNLDEFFEIRVSGLKQHIAYDIAITSSDGMTASEVFSLVADAAHGLVEEQYRVLNEELLPELHDEGIVVLRRGTWTQEQSEWVRRYFHRAVLPVLTPVGLDPSHPFPKIVNKSLNFIVSLSGEDAFGRSSPAAVVQAPRLLPRLIALPSEITDAPSTFVLLSSVIHEHVAELFPGMQIEGCYQFRVTRDSELWVEEEEVDDLLHALQGELLSRRFAGAVRVEVADNCTRSMRKFLLDQFDLSKSDLYRVNGPVNIYRFSALYDLVDRPDLKYPAFRQGTEARLGPGSDLFDEICKSDVLLHHPFQSFGPVVEFLRSAARDPQVLAIKMTVYRTGTDSPMSDALIEAARAGKEVTAVVELRARFDEAANIDLATRLQEAGAKVVYGIVGFKAHAKMLLVVRREGDQIRRYVHLGTGNYHMGTSKAYTDFGLMTDDNAMCEDVHRVFQQLTGFGHATPLERLLQSPFTLHARILELIQQETEIARSGREARIIAKMNALIEPQVIEALYTASQAGVVVDLIIRGICCLRPGLPGLSETIRVRSVMGRFLEHVRCFYFHAGGKQLVSLSSADWMPRNFFRRVETAFPVEDPALKQRVIDETLLGYLDDDRGVWELHSDGRYVRPARRGEGSISAQRALLEKLAEHPGGPAS